MQVRRKLFRNTVICAASAALLCGPLASVPTALATGSLGATVAGSGTASRGVAGLTISDAKVRPGQQVTVSGYSCPSPKHWLGVYVDGAPATSYGQWTWCNSNSWTFRAPSALGAYNVRGYGNLDDGDWYNQLFGSVDFTVYDCKNFTATMRYGGISVGDLLRSGIPIPDAARNYLDSVVVAGPVAYAQLKGDWCFGGVKTESKTIRPLEASAAGPGPVGIFFRVEPVATGSITEEQYGAGEATRYRIAQSKARVYFNNPAKVTLTIPGTQIGIEIPPGERAVFDLRMDTLLTGAGNASCASSTGNCTVETSPR